MLSRRCGATAPPPAASHGAEHEPRRVTASASSSPPTRARRAVLQASSPEPERRRVPSPEPAGCCSAKLRARVPSSSRWLLSPPVRPPPLPPPFSRAERRPFLRSVRHGYCVSSPELLYLISSSTQPGWPSKAARPSRPLTDPASKKKGPALSFRQAWPRWPLDHIWSVAEFPFFFVFVKY
jgi:hypothetical protein